MQRASLRRVGRVWAVIAAIGGVSGCGDDLPAYTTFGTSSGGSTEADTTPTTTVDTDASATTTQPGPTSDTSDGPTSDDPTTDTATSDLTTGEVDTSTTTDTGPGENQPPVALSDLYIGKARQALTPDAAAGVLKNDYDPDGDPLVVIASDPITANGSA
jgi:hypothetical protein